MTDEQFMQQIIDEWSLDDDLDLESDFFDFINCEDELFDD